MARQSVRRANATAKALALFAEEAKKLGVALDTSKIEPVSPQELREKREATVREADGVLLSLHHPHKMLAKVCRYCGENFLTNYCAVGYCSQAHRKADLKRFGIEWNYDRGEVWKMPIDGRPLEDPIVVSPEVLDKLEKFARYLLSDLDRLRSQSQSLLSEIPPILVEETLTPEDLEEQAVLALQPETLKELPLPSIQEEDDGPPTILPEPPDILDDLILDF